MWVGENVSRESSVREQHSWWRFREGRRQSAPLRFWTASDKPKAVQPGERPGSDNSNAKGDSPKKADLNFVESGECLKLDVTHSALS